MSANAATKTVLWVYDRLRQCYGAPHRSTAPAVETLVQTILSQNTNDANRDRAYASLLRRFGSLDGVRQAPVSAIAAAIRVGGLHRQKAQWIRQVLQRIESERGMLDLSFLARYELEEALAWLLTSPGVGHKTAGIVLLFSFEKPYFPVDTHVARVFRRIGVLSSRDDPHRRMNDLVPHDAATMASLHLLAIRHGREVCHARAPCCSDCVVRRRCQWLHRKESA